MYVNNNFIFEVSLSQEAYPDNIIANAMSSSKEKPGTREIRKQYGYKSNKGTSFHRIELTSSELLEKVISGHTFCNCFKIPKKLIHKDGSFGTSCKVNNYFEFSQVLCVDIDNSKYTKICDFISKLSYKPTFWYTSYNNKKLKNDLVSIRFHMIYVIQEKITNIILYRYIVRKLNELIDKETNEFIEDRSNDQAARYFKGTCFSNADLVEPEKEITNIIYSFKDFITDEKDFFNFINNNAEYVSTYINNNKNIRIKSDLEKIKSKISESVNYILFTQQILYQNEKKNALSNGLHFDDLEKSSVLYYCSPTLVSDMGRLTYEEFMKYYRHKYNYFYRIEKPVWIDNLYQYIDEDYFSLPYILPEYKIKDGNKRRKKLFYRMCLRRIMKPNVDTNTILFNAYEDVHRFFDNSDNILTPECLEKYVLYCFNNSIEELQEKFSKTIEYLKSKRPKSGIIFKRGIKRKDINNVFKNKRYDLINDYYDETKSVEENRLIISENLFPVSKDTIYRFIKERHKVLSGKLSDNELYKIIDIKLSFRKNIEILRDSDIKISQKKLQELLKMKKENIKVENTFSFNNSDFDLSELNINIGNISTNTENKKEEWDLPEINFNFSLPVQTEKPKDINKEIEKTKSIFSKLDIDLDF